MSEHGGRGSSFRKLLTNAQSVFQSSPQRSATAPAGYSCSTFYSQPSQTLPGGGGKKGWLKWHVGGLYRAWNSRWFVLSGEQLFYYAGQDEARGVLGQIYLPGYSVTELPFNANESQRFLFELSSAVKDVCRQAISHPTYLLCCESESERKDWVRCIRQALYGKIGGAIFGRALSDTLLVERAAERGRKVPELVQMCVEFLLRYGLTSEGIFRLPGRALAVKQLRNAFDSGERPPLSPSTTDVHSVASLFKSYLRDLPEPLIPVSFYEPIMNIVLRKLQLDREAAISDLTAVIATLPPASYNLLQFVCRFLREVGQSADVNRMSPENLATVFSQSFIEPECNDPALLMGTSDGRMRAALVLIVEVDRVFLKEYTVAGDILEVEDLLQFSDFPLSPCSSSIPPVTSPISDELFSLDLTTQSLPEPIHPSPIFTQLTPDLIRDTRGLEQALEPAAASEPAEALAARSVERRLSRSKPVSRVERTSKRTAVFFNGCTNEDSAVNVMAGNRVENHCVDITDESQGCQSIPELERKLSERGAPKNVEQTLYDDGARSGRRSHGRSSGLQRSMSLDAIEVEEDVRSSNVVGASGGQYGSAQLSIARNGGGGNETISPAKTVVAESGVLCDLQDTSELSREQLGASVAALRSEVVRQRDVIDALTSRIGAEGARHAAQIGAMSRRLDEERNATANAVARVVAVQSQLERYMMKHGLLE